jgi:hypothetical protein
MTTRDLVTSIKPVQHLAAAAYTATQTPSTGVDTQGFESLVALISIGVITNIANSPKPIWAFKFQESDSASASFVDVVDSNRVQVSSSKSPVSAPDASTGVFLSVDAAAEDETVYAVGLITTKRYVRVVATASNTPGSTPLSIVIELGRPLNFPTAH